VEELGFTQMTPVQAATIPLFLSNKVCWWSMDGSGSGGDNTGLKTADRSIDR
jgi:superfamily II DNA/RNA helicase